MCFGIDPRHSEILDKDDIKVFSKLQMLYTYCSRKLITREAAYTSWLVWRQAKRSLPNIPVPLIQYDAVTNAAAGFGWQDDTRELMLRIENEGHITWRLRDRNTQATNDGQCSYPLDAALLQQLLLFAAK